MAKAARIMEVQQVATLDVEDDVLDPLQSALSFAFFASSLTKYPTVA